MRVPFLPASPGHQWGCVQPGGAASLSRGRCHLALLRPWTQHGLACGGGAALSCKQDDKCTRRSPRPGPSSHPLPSGPPVNAATQQEQPWVSPQPKGGATHSRLGTASWSPGSAETGRRPSTTKRTSSAKERLPPPTFYKWGNRGTVRLRSVPPITGSLQHPPPSCWPQPPP